MWIKKVAALVMALVILCVHMVAVAAGDDQSDIHLLWGIPFGCDAVTCKSLAYENKGVVLEPPHPGSLDLSTTKDQKVSFLGYEMITHFLPSIVTK